jgi:hypothetical protein
MTRDAERLLIQTLMFTLLFVGFWLALSGGHRHLVFVISIAFLCLCFLFAYRQRSRKQDPNR